MKDMTTVSVAEINGKALTWAVASITGRALRKPRRANAADAKHLNVPFTLYEVAYILRDKKLIAANVQPITVLAWNRGNPQAPRKDTDIIEFLDGNGHMGMGDVGLFFYTEDEAKLQAREAMKGGLEGFDPGTNWSQGGPLIDEHGIMFQSTGNGAYLMAYLRKQGTSGPTGIGETHLIAAMRCLLASVTGVSVEVPSELLDTTA